MSAPRSNYEDSCRFLQTHGYLDAGELPPLPDHVPQYDDPEPLGVNFFRTMVSDEVPLDNLTLPRTFFGCRYGVMTDLCAGHGWRCRRVAGRALTRDF